MAHDHAEISWIKCKNVIAEIGASDNHGRELLIYCCLRHSGGFLQLLARDKSSLQRKSETAFNSHSLISEIAKNKMNVNFRGEGGNFPIASCLPHCITHCRELRWIIQTYICLTHAFIVIMRGKNPETRINPKDSLWENSEWNIFTSGCLLQAPVSWALFSLPLSFKPSFARWHSCCYWLTEQMAKEIQKPTERKILLLSLYLFKGTAAWAPSFTP